MKPAAVIILFLVTSMVCAAASIETGCATVTVLAHATVPGGEWSLADILAPDACAQLRQAASSIRLGLAPLPGSPRILTGENIRNLLEGVSTKIGGEKKFEIPERIVVESARPTFSRTAHGNRVEQKGNPDALVKPGDVATLVWEQGGILIQLPVICLDAGRLGQLVRARSPNGSRILRAEVVGQGALRVTSGG
jgi:Chaperone for flagella basal body P-ring formation